MLEKTKYKYFMCNFGKDVKWNICTAANEVSDPSIGSLHTYVSASNSLLCFPMAQNGFNWHIGMPRCYGQWSLWFWNKSSDHTSNFPPHWMQVIPQQLNFFQFITKLYSVILSFGHSGTFMQSKNADGDDFVFENSGTQVVYCKRLDTPAEYWKFE